MTESAEERTKRRYINNLKSYEWNYQISVFYINYDSSFNVVNDGAELKQRLGKGFKQPFLHRLCLKTLKEREIDILWIDYDRYPELLGATKLIVPYHTFFTDGEIPRKNFRYFLDKWFGNEEFYSKERRVSRWHIEKYANAVNFRKPFELHKHLKYEGKINRFAFINKKYAKPLADSR